MNKIKNIDYKKNTGAISIITALLLLFVLLGIAALGIDVGRITLAKNELQNAADAAALAGAAELSTIYQNNVNPQNIDNFVCDSTFNCTERIKNIAMQIAGKNTAIGTQVVLDSNDIKIGRWDSDSNNFRSENADGSPVTLPNAVEVTSKKNSETSNPITLFFASIFSNQTNETDVWSNKAVASLTGAQFMPEPEVTTPFAISQLMFPDDCVETVEFRPSASCGTWHNFRWDTNSNDIQTHMLGTIYRHTYTGDRNLISGEQWLTTNFNIDAGKLEDKMESLYRVSDIDDLEIAPYEVGEDFNFIGGVSATHFSKHMIDPENYDGNVSNTIIDDKGNTASNPNNPAAMFAVFDYFRYRDNDGDDNIWTAYAPIYKEEGNSVADCSNPNQSKTIVGFAKVEIIAPNGPYQSNIDVNVDCQYHMVDDDGSGITAGNAVGKTPKLVQ